MDFQWNEQQKQQYNRILTLTQQHLGGKDHGLDRVAFWSRDEWRVCGDLGLLGLSVPKEYGGQGLDALNTAFLVEAFGHGCDDMGLVFSAAAHLFACVMPIVAYANEDIKHDLLPLLYSGQWVAGNAMTEKEAGSDITAIQTRAFRDGDSYRLSGSKSYVSNGPVADVFVVYAYTDPAFSWMGISAFLVDANQPGVTIGRPFTKMGLSSCPASELHLDNCMVPERYRLGREGEGGRVFQYSMVWERACLFAAYVGMMQRQLDQCIGHAKKRQQFGKPIAKNQAISHRIVDMKLRLEAARLLLYRACWSVDQHQDVLLNAGLSKLAVSEAAIASSLDAIQVFGGSGYNGNAGIEVALRDSIPSTIFSGTSEIQYELIAAELGL